MLQISDNFTFITFQTTKLRDGVSGTKPEAFTKFQGRTLSRLGARVGAVTCVLSLFCGKLNSENLGIFGCYA